MTWTTVAQVLVIMAGAGTFQWFISREPRERSSQVDSEVKKSLTKELEELGKARDKLHREHAHMAGEGYHSFAGVAWSGLLRVEKRLLVVRNELKKLED